MPTWCHHPSPRTNFITSYPKATKTPASYFVSLSPTAFKHPTHCHSVMCSECWNFLLKKWTSHHLPISVSWKAGIRQKKLFGRFEVGFSSSPTLARAPGALTLAVGQRRSSEAVVIFSRVEEDFSMRREWRVENFKPSFGRIDPGNS
jgi:hypothetical protein